jgi:hypothetical protein
VVRHQPSKLTYTGSNPVARSKPPVEGGFLLNFFLNDKSMYLDLLLHLYGSTYGDSMDKQGLKRVLFFAIAFMLISSACNYPGIRSIQVTDAERIARVKQETPCREGPGPSYEVVTVLEAGMEVVLIGVSQRGKYVVLQQPDRPVEHCWGLSLDFLTGDYLLAEFMKLNVQDPPDDSTPDISMAYIELEVVQPSELQRVQQAGPTSTFRQRDVPVPSTSTPRVAAPISGDSLDLAPTVTMDPRFGQTVHVNRDTLCWRGPGPAYEVVHALFSGQDAKAIGHDASNEWYILDSPVYPGTNCWAQRDAVDSPTEQIALPIVPVPLLPTRTTESGSSGGSPVCYEDLPQPACEAAGGTWMLAVPPPNQCNCP